MPIYNTTEALCAQNSETVYFTSIYTAENHVTSKTTTMVDTIEKPHIDSVRLSLIFPLKLVRFAWGLTQIHVPQKNDSSIPIVCDFRTNIWFYSY